MISSLPDLLAFLTSPRWLEVENKYKYKIIKNPNENKYLFPRIYNSNANHQISNIKAKNATTKLAQEL